MRKHRTTHRHQIRGLFLTFSATIVCSTLCISTSFAQSVDNSFDRSYSDMSSRSAYESSLSEMSNPNRDAINYNTQATPDAEQLSEQNSAQLAGKTPTQISSGEFNARTPSINSVYPLGWEARVPQGFQWSDFTLKVINQYGTALNNAKDVTSFCPNYNKLAQDQRLNFWGQLVSAMAQYESGFKPTSHYREGTMGVDPITRQHVYSDGLLQLSYQDVTQYHFCDEFNWSHDSQFGALDPRKTIFDPYINLRCGIRILNAEVARTGLISYRKGQYWSVLWPAHVAKIKAVTRKIPYCTSK